MLTENVVFRPQGRISRS